MTSIKSSSSLVARVLDVLSILSCALFSSAVCSDPIRLPAAQADHGVVLLYHHIDENTPTSTSTTPARFEEHLEHIEQWGYTVMPLEEMIATLRSGGLIPDKALAITFDDAGVVQNIVRYGLEDGKVVPLVQRVTESSDGDISFLRKLFGNVGGLDLSSAFNN